MQNNHPTSSVEVGARPVHPILLPVAAAFLLGAFVTDVLYVETVLGMWETFSIWLLTAGLLIAPFAGIALLVDLVGRRRFFRPAWFRLLIAVIAALLSLINAFVHSRDGYTAVVPTGLTLSTIVAVILVVLGCYGWNLSVPSRAAAAN
jgi:uncharacterized membrane protein